MRILIYIFIVFFSMGTVDAQLTINGKISTVPTTYVNTNGKIGTGEGLLTSGKKTKTFVCGDDIMINHVTTDGVAPLAKTVTYKTVLTTISGASKCWITSNLGATNEASSATDATENASGWYWQFNYKRGYKYAGTTRTPTAWTSSGAQPAQDWQPANDPCTIELGAGWRIPNLTEWTAVRNTNGYLNNFSSVLKIHAAGYLAYQTGVITDRGTGHHYWSSDFSDVTFARAYVIFPPNTYTVSGNNRLAGFSVRCIKD
ncbi:MAG: hypothetical protein ACK4X2_04475 [Bacteroidota bacterium]|jgi:uncharacterized protein (TIGR02145 family)